MKPLLADQLVIVRDDHYILVRVEGSIGTVITRDVGPYRVEDTLPLTAREQRIAEYLASHKEQP